jgi:alpha-mannosidase
MTHTSRYFRWSLPIALTTVILLAASITGSAGTRGVPSFPDSIQCTVQPFYKYRSDRTPGREIGVSFKGSRLFGAARVEIQTGTVTESLQLPARSDGIDSVAVLLPANVGVKEPAQVRITVRQGTRTLAREIPVAAMRHWTVFVYPHSHVDIGYSNTHANVEFIHKRNIDQGIALADSTHMFPAGAQYRWNTEVMWPFERYFVSASQPQKDRLVKAVQSGSLSLDAAYVHVLTTDCSDEEMFQALRPRSEAARLTGAPLDTYVQVDVPGMAWGLVPVLAHEGVKYIMMMPNGTRGNDSMVTMLRQKPVWWVGQDGTSRVLFLNAGGYSVGLTKGGKTGRPWFGQRDREKIPDVIRTNNPRADFLDQHLFSTLPQMENAHHPYDLFVVTWAMWDNALLDADLPLAVRSWNEEYAFPHLEIASAHTIMQAFEKRYGDRFPVVTGDFTEYWTDGFGTVARETRTARNATDRLVQAETLWPMLHPGTAAPRGDMNEAWRNAVMCTEHTFTYENPTEPYFQDAIWRMKQRYFQEVDERSHLLLDDALAPATDKSNGALGPAEGPSHGGVAVFNTNSWTHGGLVTLTRAESQTGDRVLDEAGHEVLAQRLSTGELAFLCPPVPAFGSRHFRVTPGSCTLQSTCRFTAASLDNGTLSIALDPATGNVIHLRDKMTGRDYADASHAGGINAFRWLPAKDAGNARSDSVRTFTLKENGPLIGEIQIVSAAPGCNSLIRSVRLMYGAPSVEITNVVDKLPLLPKDGIHFGFGFNISAPRARVDIPWGVMELGKDQWAAANRAWTATQQFVDVSNDSAGVTWCSLDAPLVEYGGLTANNTANWDGKGDVWPAAYAPVPAIYSWAMNNHWFTNTPLTQEGPVTFRYALRPHGPYDASAAYRFGREHTQPLIALATSIDPATRPVVNIAGDHVVATILKASGDGRSTIIRLRSFSGTIETVGLTWPARTPKVVRVCEHGEEPGTKDASATVNVPPMGMVTLRAEW